MQGDPGQLFSTWIDNWVVLSHDHDPRKCKVNSDILSLVELLLSSSEIYHIWGTFV